jgi:cathepsin B
MNIYGTYLFSDDKFKKQFSEISIDNTPLKNEKKLNINIPDNFDGRIIWKDYIKNDQYQSQCISCWAFASLYTLSSRLSIYTKGKYNLTFSPGKMIFQRNQDWDTINKNITNGISPDTKNDIIISKCNENTLLHAWRYLYSFGVPESKCVNDQLRLNNIYSSDTLFGDSFDTCPTDNSEMVHHRVSGYYYVPGTISKSSITKDGNEMNIRRDIYHWGPCSTVMRIFKDFLEWDGKGIYKWDTFSEQVNTCGHAVVIIGWGEENGTKYWIIRNSWKGDKEFFKILRGVNHCEIEENVIVGYPTLPGIRLFLEHPILYSFDDMALRGIWNIQDNGYKLTTYEKLILNQDNKFDKTNNEFIYKMEYWPDFSKLVAGELDSIVYNIKVKENYKSMLLYHRRKNTFCNNNIIIFIIILLLIIYLFFL